MKAEYDYIICGGGTTGSVVAARLAEDANISVLVIEAGEHNEVMENTIMTGGWSMNFDTDADWNITTQPNPGANSRQIKVSRGKFLGGSSGCNGTLCIRGIKQDYDDWNMPGWSGEEVFSYMMKAENFHNKPWFNSCEEAHGTNGKLDVEPHDLAPISELILDSMIDQGLPLHEDMFSTGETPCGCGHVPRTVYKGDRVTAANFLLGLGSNLDIKTNSLVDRVLLTESSSSLRASAVVVLDKDGNKSEVKARKEIIVSGGAYCSPAILMRSGIGARAELEQHGIECKVNLPGVGRNLMDHLIVFIYYETEKSGLTNDYLLYHGDAFRESYRQWKEEKRGALSTFPFGAFAYARLDERMADDPIWTKASHLEGRDPMGLTPSQPNIEFFSTECYGGPKQYADFPTDNKHAFSIICELFAPRSRGTVTIKSKDPMDNPVVDHNYLSDELDLAVLAEACTFGNEIIMRGKGTKDVVRGSWPSDLIHHTYTNREQWKPFVRENATTCYHPGGTCKMGPSSDVNSVLDERLQVRGVKGLRVADTSIMPLLNQGHTQMPAYAIGEKAADLIRENTS